MNAKLKSFYSAAIATMVFAVPTGVHAEGTTLAKIKETKTITIGYREAAIPFSYLSPDEKPIGFSIDLCARIAAAVKSRLKLDALAVKYIAVNSSNRVPLVKNGTVDIVCGSTFNTLARQKEVSFTVATATTDIRWLAKVDSGIENAAQLKGKTVATIQGSTSIAVIQGLNAKAGLDLKLIYAKDHAEGMLLLSTGRIAALMEDDVLLHGLKADASDPAAFKFLPERYGNYYYGLMLSKNDLEFRTLADEVITHLMASGEFAKLYGKWFLEPIPPHHHSLDFHMSETLKERITHPSDKVNN